MDIGYVGKDNNGAATPSAVQVVMICAGILRSAPIKRSLLKKVPGLHNNKTQKTVAAQRFFDFENVRDFVNFLLLFGEKGSIIFVG